MQRPSVSRSPEILWAITAMVALCGFGWALGQLKAGFEAAFDSIKPGMTQPEVRALLGEPTRILEPMPIETPAEQKLHEKYGLGFLWWTYDLPKDSGSPVFRFVVLFDEDKVARTEKRLIAQD